MEYKDFVTSKKDKCQDDFRMNLLWDDSNVSDSTIQEIYNEIACNAHRDMTLKGVMFRNESGAGHLGLLKYEFSVIEIIEISEVHYSRVSKKKMTEDAVKYGNSGWDHR